MSVTNWARNTTLYWVLCTCYIIDLYLDSSITDAVAEKLVRFEYDPMSVFGQTHFHELGKLLHKYGCNFISYLDRWHSLSHKGKKDHGSLLGSPMTLFSVYLHGIKQQKNMTI
jgi:hypothetical protein